MTVSLLLERTDDLLEKLYRALPAPNPTLLFETTELQRYREQSPIWLNGAASAEVVELMRGAPRQWPGLIIESQAPDETLLSHLRHILFVYFDKDRRGVLRYTSPTTASYFFTVDDPGLRSTWLGPIARIAWHGGTWQEVAQGNLQWFTLDNSAAIAWQAPPEQRTLTLNAVQAGALQRQQKEQFIYQWWSKQAEVSFATAEHFVNEGISKGLVEATVLTQYLALRAHQDKESLI